MSINYYLLTLLGWITFIIVIYGVGDIVNLLLKKIFQIRYKSFSYRIIIGFCSLLLLLSIIQIFIPLNIFVLIPFLVIGIWRTGIFLLNQLKKKVKPSKLSIIFIVASLLICLLVLNKTFGKDFVYDTGYYYIQVITWLNKQHLIVGLANIHERFGFNNSSFLIPALFENLNLLQNDFRWVSSAIIIFPVLFSLYNFYKYIRYKRQSISTVFFSFIWFPILLHAFTEDAKYIVSISPDTTVYILELLLAGVIISFVEANSKKSLEKKFFLSMLLAASIYSVKVSGAVFAVCCVALVLFIMISKFGLKNLLKEKFVIFSLSLTTVFVLITLLRAYLLSGYPLYPLTFPDFHPKWSVGQEVARNERCLITGWARNSKVSCQSLNTPWLSHWFEVFISTFIPLFTIITGLVLSVLNIFKRYLFKKEFLGLLIVCILSLVYWFLAAPAFRFAFAIFWIVLLLNFSVLVWSLKRKSVYGILFMGLIAILFFNRLDFNTRWISNIDMDLEHRYQGTKVLESKYGVKGTNPNKGLECWDIVGVCTPYFNDRLDYLNPEKGITGGLYIKNN